MSRLPRLADITPARDAQCPRVSVIFAARDEAEKLSGALATILAQDYVKYEVVGVNDRSQDATPQILDQFASTSKLLKVVHVAELPAGWLGKPHALQRGYEQASGDWLLFTDADVRFAPDLLRRAIAVAQESGWDHLTLLAGMDMDGFWESVAITYLAVGFTLGVEPWLASAPSSQRYAGVGAFQLVRRQVYEAIGTHKRLAMEVLEDMKLGKLVKQGGFRSGVGMAGEAVRVRWQAGLRNIIRGTTKNFFAASSYSVARIAGQITQLLAFSVLPFAALPWATGKARIFAMIAALIPLVAHYRMARSLRVSPLYALTHPLGGIIFGYMLLRSTVVTLWRGGVVWRDTFYPLKQLKRGMV